MAKDLLFDESGAFRIKNGDFVIGDSSQQHIEDILLANKGEYKQSPFTGVGIQSFLKSPLDLINISKLEKSIRLQLEADGAANIVVDFKDNKLNVSANYD